MTNAFASVRFTGENEIEGFLAVWGTPQKRDCWDTWFDKEHPPTLGLEYLPVPLFLEHGMDPEVKKVAIGKVTHAWVDEAGIKFRATLYADQPNYRKIKQKILNQRYGTSTGTADYLSEFDEEKRFRTWFVFDVTLTESPCEHRMPKVSFVDAPGIGRTRNSQGTETNQNQLRYRLGVPSSGGQTSCPICTQRNEHKMPTLEELGVPSGTDVTALLSALVESEGWEAIMQALQSMQQPEEQAPATAAPAPAAMSQMAQTTGASQAPPVAALSQLMQELIKLKKSSPSGATAPAAPTQSSDGLESIRAELAKIQKMLVQPPDNSTSINQSSGRADVRPEARVNHVVDLRYDHLSARDMVIGDVWMEALHRSGMMRSGPSQEYVSVAAQKMIEEIEEKKNPVARSAFRSFAIHSGNPAMRAGELMGTGVVGGGKEWVSIFYDQTLWEVIRQNTIYEAIISKGLDERELPQGSDTYNLKLEGADPTWYAVGQSVDEDASGQPKTLLSSSKFGTTEQVVTTSKLGAAVTITGELEEDSLIPVIPELRRKLDISGKQQMEYILLNGDTTLTASTNINLIDGTPTATALGSMPSYTLLNGFIKNALLGAAGANARDGGALAVEDYLDTLKLMGVNGKNSISRDAVCFIIDNMTYYATLALADVKSRDVFVGATLENGEISKMWGRDILVSEQMALSNLAGKISATPANNTFGRILALRPDQWVLVWKRKTTTEVQRWARADSTELVTYLRLGLKERDAEASAISYHMIV